MNGVDFKLGTIEEGARNAVLQCMGVKKGEHVYIVSDKQTLAVGSALKEQAEKIVGADNVKIAFLEDFSGRPLKSLPKEINSTIPWADVTFWAAQSLAGELPTRQQFLEKAKMYARHGHMPNIDTRLMEQGMCADYNEVFDVTRKIFNAVRKVSKIRVKNDLGLELSIEFDKSWRWVPSDGRFLSKGRWGNLPDGEVFTAPKNVNGTIITNLLGDSFSAKYGNFKDSLTLQVSDSRIELESIKCQNKSIQEEIAFYLSTEENSKRASEFALPTNPLLMKLPTIGNLLQDEKARVHIAFGDPYQEETGASWKSSTHVDMLLESCDLWIDGDVVMRNGAYTV